MISWESSKWVETQPKVLWLPVQYFGLFWCMCRWECTTKATHKTFKSSNWHVKFWKNFGRFGKLGENNFYKYYFLTWNVKPCNPKGVSIIAEQVFALLCFKPLQFSASTSVLRRVFFCLKSLHVTASWKKVGLFGFFLLHIPKFFDVDFECFPCNFLI